MMIKVLSVFVLAAALLPALPLSQCGNGGPVAQNAPAPWGNLAKYKHDNAVVMTAPAEQRRVVFFGNSITEYWAEKDSAFFASNGFVGRGISGQTSYQYLVRFRQDALNLHPRVVVINAGTNDVAENTHPYDESATMGNIISLVQLARAEEVQPVLTTTLPCSHFYWNPQIEHVSEKIQSLNRRIKAYAAEQGIPFVDYYTPMVSSGGSLDSRLSEDGVHPNLEGYKVMEAQVMAVIEPLLRR